MMLVGMLWAVAAPLLLLAAAALLAWLLQRTGWPRPRRLVVAALLVLAPTATLWWLDHRGFTTVCQGVGAARILARAQADGIVLESPTANSFGTRYLHEQGFEWMEIRSIADRQRYERWTRLPDGQVRTEPIDAPTARYEVRETFEQPQPHTSVSMTRVFDRSSGQLMAQAGSARFDGGRARWVLGVYGTDSCPATNSDAAAFRAWYNLARLTLRDAER